MCAEATRKRNRERIVAFRYSPERKAMLTAIMHKYGHADLSETCRMLMDEGIDRHLLRPESGRAPARGGLYYAFADDIPGMIPDEDAEIPEPTCNPRRTK